MKDLIVSCELEGNELIIEFTEEGDKAVKLYMESNGIETPEEAVHKLLRDYLDQIEKEEIENDGIYGGGPADCCDRSGQD